MKILELSVNPKIYSCRPYLVLGSWNRLTDVNTLVDVGADGQVIDEISAINTGLGKRPVDRVILTHGHFDHAGGVLAVKRAFGCEVLAWAPGPGVDRLLRAGERLELGDRRFEVIHAPQHSHDSIILFCHEDGVLFTGDSPVNIKCADGTYLQEYVDVIERLAALPIERIFAGHDWPVRQGGGAVLRRSLELIRHGSVVEVGVPWSAGRTALSVAS